MIPAQVQASKDSANMNVIAIMKHTNHPTEVGMICPTVVFVALRLKMIT